MLRVTNRTRGVRRKAWRRTSSSGSWAPLWLNNQRVNNQRRRLIDPSSSAARSTSSSSGIFSLFYLAVVVVVVAVVADVVRNAGVDMQMSVRTRASIKTQRDWITIEILDWFLMIRIVIRRSWGFTSGAFLSLLGSIRTENDPQRVSSNLPGNVAKASALRQWTAPSATALVCLHELL